MSETVTYSVPGMTCGHCRRPSVEASRKRSGANRHPWVRRAFTSARAQLLARSTVFDDG